MPQGQCVELDTTPMGLGGKTGWSARKYRLVRHGTKSRNQDPCLLALEAAGGGIF